MEEALGKQIAEITRILPKILKRSVLVNESDFDQHFYISFRGNRRYRKAVKKLYPRVVPYYPMNMKHSYTFTIPYHGRIFGK